MRFSGVLAVGAALYITSVYSPLSATAPGEGRLVVVTTSQLFAGKFDRVETSFNIRDLDPETVALRKSPHGNFYIFAARTTGGALKIYDRTHGQSTSSLAFEVCPEYGTRFAKAFKWAVILAKNDKASLAAKGEEKERLAEEAAAQPVQFVQRRNDWAERILAQEQKPVKTWGEARRYCSAHPDGSVLLGVIFTCTVVIHYRLKPSELDLMRDKYDLESDSFGARSTASTGPQCSEQAKAYAKDRESSLWSYQMYANHYDPKTNVCYVVIRQVKVNPVDATTETKITAADAFGNNEVAYFHGEPFNHDTKGYDTEPARSCRVDPPKGESIFCRKWTEAIRLDFERLVTKYCGVEVPY